MAYDDGSAVPGGARGSPAGLNIPLFHTMVLSSEGVPSSLATVPSAEKLISKFSEGYPPQRYSCSRSVSVALIQAVCGPVYHPIASEATNR